jgi:hypothetical protein
VWLVEVARFPALTFKRTYILLNRTKSKEETEMALIELHQASLALAVVAFWAGDCEFKYPVAWSG